MPVYLDRTPPDQDLLKHAKVVSAKSDSGSFRSAANCIYIGLVNNMPDGALQSTERQFLALLHSAAHNFNVRLTFYRLAGIPRSDWALRRMESFYSSVEDLQDATLDGLIVTGTEPCASKLKDEPYWASFTKLLDWAEENTLSSVWSCLAAHAAVLHLDGIERRRLSDKRFGLFECAPVSNHSLIAGNPSSLFMPHSRWNDLPEEHLAGCGYEALTRSRAAGVDSFIKPRKSLFLFCQGHPEYEANTLLLEYRRDIGRYLRGERNEYPNMPHGYFNAQARNALTTFQERAMQERSEGALAQFPMAQAERGLGHRWWSPAVGIYRNWLTCVSAAKERRALGTQFTGYSQVVLEPRLATGAD